MEMATWKIMQSVKKKEEFKCAGGGFDLLHFMSVSFNINRYYKITNNYH